jgi:hypothetical protein
MKKLKAFRHELIVYVVWHPDFAAGKSLASFLYDQLTRDSQVPLSRGLGVPVYLRTSVDAQSVPEAIPFGGAAHVVVVLLVDDEMVLGRDQGWGNYVQNLLEEAKAGPNRILPVKLSANAFSLNAELRNANFLPLDTVAAKSRQQRLLIGVVHDLCRLLQDEPLMDYSASDPNAKPKMVAKPVRIFISHAKKDGEALAIKIRNYISKNLQLDSFFDKNQIYYAEDFAKVLEQNVEQSALLVLQTDAYCTREWCQREVLIAKRHGRPLVVLHKVEVGEARSFPYLGNLPVIRFKDKMPIDEVIGKLLLEVLKAEYFPKHVRCLAHLFDRPLADLMPLARTPELLNVSGSRTGKIVVYPDPPLGNHEVELLRDFHKDYQLTTLLFLLAGTPSLDGALIGLSLSGIAPEAQLDAELQKLGFLRAHFDDAVAEIARFLLAGGADLAYGGDLRVGGFTEQLHDLVRLYGDPTAVGDQPRFRIRNFLSWVAHVGKDDRILQFMDCLEPERLPLPNDVIAELGMDPQHAGPPPFQANTAQSNYLDARCHTAMREAMNGRIAARVLLGGPLTGYSGRYPGLVEEAYFAIRAKLPVYLIGAFGGCTRTIIDALEGRKPTELTLPGQLLLDDEFRQKNPELGKTPYQERLKDFNRRAAKTSGVEPIDYHAVLKCFTSQGIAGISRTNGLSKDENRRLFVTSNIHEIIYFVLKGLNELMRKGRLRLQEQ